MEEKIKRLKEDRAFLEELKQKKMQALKSGDIVNLYDLLDTMLLLDMDEVDELYSHILQIAFDALAEKLTKGERFNFNDERELYIARAVYEHALERWDSEDLKGAKELFLVLSFMVPENYQKGILLALGATAKGIELDIFLDEFIDKEKLNEDSFFFDKFTPKAEEFLAKEQMVVKRELAQIEKLREQ